MSESLRLSQNAVRELVELARSGRDSLQRLANSLNEDGSTITSLKAFQSEVQAKLGRELSDLVEKHLFGLMSYAETSGVDVRDAIDSLTISIKRQVNEEEFEQWVGIKQTITQLALSPLVRCVFKSVDLIYDRAHVLQSARIITDIRPIFDDEGDTFDAVVLSHTLRLNVWESGQQRVITLGVDDRDLQEIQEACQRAQRKAVACRESIERAGLTVMKGES